MSETDAAEVEALAELLAESFDEWLFRMHGVTSSCRHEAEGEGLAETILASDWLAAREAAAEARRAERALREAVDVAERQMDAFLTSAEFEAEHAEWIAGWHSAVRQVVSAITRGVEGGAFDRALTETRSEYRDALDRWTTHGDRRGSRTEAATRHARSLGAVRGRGVLRR